MGTQRAQDFWSAGGDEDSAAAVDHSLEAPQKVNVELPSDLNFIINERQSTYACIIHHNEIIISFILLHRRERNKAKKKE